MKFSVCLLVVTSENRLAIHQGCFGSEKTFCRGPRPKVFIRLPFRPRDTYTCLGLL